MSHDKTAVKRQSKYRERQKEVGGRRFDLRLTPEANEAGERVKRPDESLTAMINRLILEEDKRLRNPDNGYIV